MYHMTKRVIKGGQTIPRMRGQSVLENNIRLDKVVFVKSHTTLCPRCLTRAFVVRTHDIIVFLEEAFISFFLSLHTATPL